MPLIQADIPGRTVPAGRPNIARTSLQHLYERTLELDTGNSQDYNDGVYRVTKRADNLEYVEKSFGPRHLLGDEDEDDGPGRRSGALNEMILHRRLKHSQIVEYHDSCIVVDAVPISGHLYMEWCDGESLVARLKESPPILELHRWEILLSALNALAYCHTGAPNMLEGIMNNGAWEPIFHRDIASRNIFIKSQPATDIPLYKVADFGISQYKGDEHHHLPAWPIQSCIQDLIDLKGVFVNIDHYSQSLKDIVAKLSKEYLQNIISKRINGEETDYRQVIINAVREAFDPEMGGALAYLLPYDQGERNKSLVARVVDTAAAPN